MNKERALPICVQRDAIERLLDRVAVDFACYANRNKLLRLVTMERDGYAIITSRDRLEIADIANPSIP